MNAKPFIVLVCVCLAVFALVHIVKWCLGGCFHEWRWTQRYERQFRTIDGKDHIQFIVSESQCRKCGKRIRNLHLYPGGEQP